MFDIFIDYFGTAEYNSGLSLADFSLEHSKQFRTFQEIVGGGVFMDGFLSILSTREKTSCLEWGQWLPPQVRLVASTAFGFLAFSSGEDLWLVDSQYGQIIESDVSLESFLDDLCSAESKEMLHMDLFDKWRLLGGKLSAEEFLSPCPSLALGGIWDLGSLQVMNAESYLSFTGQLFQKNGDMPADIYYLEG